MRTILMFIIIRRGYVVSFTTNCGFIIRTFNNDYAYASDLSLSTLLLIATQPKR